MHLMVGLSHLALCHSITLIHRRQLMSPLRMAVVGVGHLGQAHARVLAGLDERGAGRRRRRRAPPRPGRSRTGTTPAPTLTTARCWTGPTRLHRRPDLPSSHRRDRISRTRHSAADRKADRPDGRAGRASRGPGPQQGRRHYRSAILNDSIRRSRRLVRPADPPEIRRMRTARAIHRPIHRHRRRARSDGPRSGPAQRPGRVGRRGR